VRLATESPGGQGLIVWRNTVRRRVGITRRLS
jgi:hypothetical protein